MKKPGTSRPRGFIEPACGPKPSGLFGRLLRRCALAIAAMAAGFGQLLALLCRQHRHDLSPALGAHQRKLTLGVAQRLCGLLRLRVIEGVGAPRLVQLHAGVALGGFQLEQLRGLLVADLEDLLTLLVAELQAVKTLYRARIVASAMHGVMTLGRRRACAPALCE